MLTRSLVIRLAWLHAQASRDRWWEEVTLLREELRRVGESFTYREMEWISVADAAHINGTDEARLTRGAKAYAYRQAAVYKYLASEAKQRYDEATRPYKPKAFGSSMDVE